VASDPSLRVVVVVAAVVVELGVVVVVSSGGAGVRDGRSGAGVAVTVVVLAEPATSVFGPAVGVSPSAAGATQPARTSRQASSATGRGDRIRPLGPMRV